jgi:hypothetical protein
LKSRSLTVTVTHEQPHEPRSYSEHPHTEHATLVVLATTLLASEFTTGTHVQYCMVVRARTLACLCVRAASVCVCVLNCVHGHATRGRVFKSWCAAAQRDLDAQWVGSLRVQPCFRSCLFHQPCPRSLCSSACMHKTRHNRPITGLAGGWIAATGIACCVLLHTGTSSLMRSKLAQTAP